MRNILLILCSSLLLLTSGCQSNVLSENYCGYVLTDWEVINLTKRFEKQTNPYEWDEHMLYDQLNDSIRATIPDTFIFEIFLGYISEKEICMILYGPKNKTLMETASCIIMNGQFGDVMPEQRYMFFYSYPESSTKEEDLLFEVVVKRKKD